MGLLYSIMGALFSKCAPSAEQGFTEDFDPPLKDGLKCCICHHGLRNAKQTHCGHRFCESCINQSIRNKGRKCPVSGCEHPIGTSELYPDNFANREILKANVRCKLKQTHGCAWKGPLQDFEYHLNMTCLYVSVKCDCGCEIPRGDLQRHVLTGCPRTKDWRQEAIVIEHRAEDEVSPLPFPVKEMDRSSSPGQITGTRRPVEHHQGKELTSNVKQLREAGNESKQLDSPVKPKPYQSREDGKKGHGFDPPPHQKEGSNAANWLGPALELKEQLEQGNEAKELYPPAEPKESLALQNNKGNEASELEVPLAEPKEPLSLQKEDGDKANRLYLPVEAQESLAHQKEDGDEANRLDPPVETRDSLAHQKEDANEVNGFDPSGEPKGLLAHQMEDDNEAIFLDGPGESKEPLACQKKNGYEVNGLDPPAEMEEGNKAIALDPLAERKEPSMYQKEDGNDVNELDHRGEPRESMMHQLEKDNEAIVLDPPADVEPLMYQKQDGNEVNGLDHPTEPKESSMHQIEESNEAIALDLPVELKEPLMYQKEEGHKADELDPFVKPNEPDPPVHPKEDGCEANRLDLSAKPTEPSPCQGEDAKGLNVSSQNHVPSFI
ncbi:uncharacterized protein LOC110063301 [Orbicella faveolata]|uniref:uncharacterized protein LOC110063301 n=1 Tax=Orbicella faveolata TaxID=48498 RepID=UPI0009E50819|nr:uncharacterized protein LOC110063301 [Orbicella faveolata]